MAHWRQFRPRAYDASTGIQLGALVCLVDADDPSQHFFLGPDGGSMKLTVGDQLVQVISSEAPLAKAMQGKCEGNEVSIRSGSSSKLFEVLRVLSSPSGPGPHRYLAQSSLENTPLGSTCCLSTLIARASG